VKTAVVTGANGFVGRHLCGELVRRGWQVRVITRGQAPAATLRLDVALEAGCADLAAHLAGVDVVYHLAGIAHERIADADPDVLLAVNVDAASRLLAAADQAGVPQVVWLSSIKVLGDVSLRPLRPNDPYCPGDAYARSKVRAEQTLQDFPAKTAHLAVVRPPLVYGSGVGGNFLRLLQCVDWGLPLPLAAATGLRSMVGVDNLCDLLLRLSEPKSGIFHVADGDDLSVAQLIGALCEALERPNRLWPVSSGLLAGVARLAGRASVHSRLFDSLQVDQSETAQALAWQPPHANQQQLQLTATWFQHQQ
jgi:nucleoside-diphosphate-sugar epimerase